MAEGIQSGGAFLDRQHDRLLRLSFPQGGEPAGARLVINRLDAREGVSRDFEYTAELLSSNADLALKDLQGKMLCIDLVRADGSLRHFTGIVFAFRLVKTDGNLAFYEARLGPWLRYLRLRSNTNGIWREHAAVHSLVGPNSKGSPKLPEPTQLPKGQLDLHNHYIKSDGTPRQAVKQGEYTVVDSEGGTHSGNLDAKGFATVSGLPIGGAKITFGPDPRDPWDEGSYFGPPHEWPPKPLDEKSTTSPAGGAGALPAANLLSAKGVLGGAKGALGQIGQVAGTAQQAVAAVQAVQQGGAQALLGQVGQLASGAATQAIGKAVGGALGPMGAPAAGVAGSVVAGGMNGGLAGAAAAAQSSVSGAVASVVPKLPGALPSLPSLGGANPATAMTGRTPGFAG